MKFLGQYIQDFIARFRSDVYLEDVASGTIASGGNLGLDSNNKIVKADVPEDGDINRVQFTTSSGNATVSSGNADFTLSGTSPIGVSNSGTTITIAANDSTTSSKGIASFSSDNFAASSGEITIKSGGVDLTDEVTGVLPVANTAAKVTSIVAGDGIDVSGATGDVTVTAETATDSNPGIVELATTAEATTGTDTSRAVTAAGLKSHVDAKFAYQYISFTGNVTANTSGNGYWEYPTANGISNHTWTQIVKNTTGGTDNRDTTTVGDEVGIDRLNQGSAGVRIPYAGIIVGFTGGGRNASGDRVYYAGLFVGTPDWGTNNDINAELVAVAAADNNSGSYLSRPSKLEDLSRSYSISAGDVIYPAFKGSGTNADIIQANITIVIKTPLV